MDMPTPEQIKAMPQEEQDKLNRKLNLKIASSVLGMIFVKSAVPRVLTTLTAAAIISYAKKHPELQD